MTRYYNGWAKLYMTTHLSKVTRHNARAYHQLGRNVRVSDVRNGVF